jgi:hypothetical protein
MHSAYGLGRLIVSSPSDITLSFRAYVPEEMPAIRPVVRSSLAMTSGPASLRDCWLRTNLNLRRLPRSLLLLQMARQHAPDGHLSQEQAVFLPTTRGAICGTLPAHRGAPMKKAALLSIAAVIFGIASPILAGIFADGRMVFRAADGRLPVALGPKGRR